METGEIIQEGAAADLAHNPEVRRAYLGKGGHGPGASSGQADGGEGPKSEIRNPKGVSTPK